jgi:hypothetical protein
MSADVDFLLGISALLSPFFNFLAQVFPFVDVYCIDLVL